MGVVLELVLGVDAATDGDVPGRAVGKGDRLIVSVEADGSLVLRSLREQVGKLKGILRPFLLDPKKSVVDEFLRERREEAERE